MAEAVVRIADKNKFLPKKRDSYFEESSGAEMINETKKSSLKEQPISEERERNSVKEDENIDYDDDDNKNKQKISPNKNDRPQNEFQDYVEQIEDFPPSPSVPPHTKSPKVETIEYEEKVYPNSFMIITSNTNIICYADNPEDMDQWIHAIEVRF